MVGAGMSNHCFPAVSLTCCLSNLFNFLGSFGGTNSPLTNSESGFQIVLLGSLVWDVVWDGSPVAFDRDGIGNCGCHERPTTGFRFNILCAVTNGRREEDERRERGRKILRKMKTRTFSPVQAPFKPDPKTLRQAFRFPARWVQLGLRRVKACRVHRKGVP